MTSFDASPLPATASSVSPEDSSRPLPDIAAVTCRRVDCSLPPSGWHGFCDAHREKQLDERHEMPEDAE